MYKCAALLLMCLLVAPSALSQDADPTRPLVVVNPTNTPLERPPQLSLTGIWFQPGNSRAYINGSVYRVGDELGRFQILDIEPDRVRLRSNGSEVTLTVFGTQRIIIGEQEP